MASVKKQREFKEAWDAWVKTDEGKKQYEATIEAWENIDLAKVAHKLFEYYDTIPPEQAVIELENSLANFMKDKIGGANVQQALLDYFPIEIERQKKRVIFNKFNKSPKAIMPEFKDAIFAVFPKQVKP